VLDATEAGIAAIVEASAKLKPVLLVGAALRRNGRLYNCALAIARGRILGVVPEELFLPNYREYYEKRWFALGRRAWPGSRSTSRGRPCRSAPT
jgi:NAD+ synthase (glutamine-hydrolysing)